MSITSPELSSKLELSASPNNLFFGFDVFRLIEAMVVEFHLRPAGSLLIIGAFLDLVLFFRSIPELISLKNKHIIYNFLVN